MRDENFCYAERGVRKREILLVGRCARYLSNYSCISVKKAPEIKKLNCHNTQVRIIKALHEWDNAAFSRTISANKSH